MISQYHGILTRRAIAGLVFILALSFVLTTPREALAKGKEADPTSPVVTVTVTGRVFDKLTVQPLPGALVRGHITNYPFLISGQPDVFDRSWYAETRTDKKGAYRLSFIVPVTTTGPREKIGSVCVDASAKGYKTKPQYAKPHVTQENTDYSNVNFSLWPGRRVHGKVVDEDGKPLTGALVTVNNGLNGDWHYFGSLGRTTTVPS